MGTCCTTQKKQRNQPRPRNSRPHSTYKQIQSIKDQSLISRQRHLYLLRENKLLIYNIDRDVAWVEDVSMRGRITGHYASVKTGTGQLFILQGTYAVLVDVELLTGIEKSPPPFSVTRCSLCYQDRCVYVAGEKLMVLHLDRNTWTDLPLPANYAFESGCFLLENKLYLLGGVRGNVLVKEVLVYSLIAKSWLSSTISLPIAMRLPSCVSMDDGKVLICCGFTQQNSPLSKTFVFDLFKFSSAPNPQIIFPTQPTMAIAYKRNCFIMRGDGMVAVFNNGVWTEINVEMVYEQLHNFETQDSVAGDEDIERRRQMIPKRAPRPERLYTYSAKFEGEDCCFIIELNTLSLESRQVDLSAYVNKPYKYAGICALGNGKVMIAGGLSDAEAETSLVLEYDPSSGKLAETVELPQPQAFIAFTCLCDKIYALGSVSIRARKLKHRVPKQSYFQKFSIVDKTWEVLPEPPVPMLAVSLSYLSSVIFAFVGVAVVNAEYDYGSIYEYQTTSDVWRMTEIKYPVPVGGIHTVNTLQHRILCFGGFDLTSKSRFCDVFSFDGKGFKEKESCPFDCERSCPVVGINSEKIFAVDTRGVYHIFDLGKGKWEVEVEELKASVF